jgi:hypothetical protein
MWDSLSFAMGAMVAFSMREIGWEVEFIVEPARRVDEELPLLD